MEDVQQALNEKLGSRPSANELEKQRIIHNAEVAPSIAGAAHNVEKSLNRRSSKADLTDRGIYNSYDPATYQAEKDRMRQEKQQQLQKNMNSRPSAAELERRGVLYDQRVDPSLQASAIALKQEQIRRNLAASMGSRPNDPNSIPYMEHNNIAPSVRGVAYDLNNQLKQRPNTNDVSHLQQAYSNQAPSLQPAGYAVANAMSNRPTYDDLQARGYVGVGERKAKNTELLQQQLGRRQSRQEISGMIPHSNMAPSLQGAAYNLQAGLANRQAPSQPEYVRTNMASAMQPAAYELNKKLGRRMSRDDVAARGLLDQRNYQNEASKIQEAMKNRPNQLPAKYAPHQGMASSIQAPAHALKQALRSRPTQQQVQYFSEDASRQAPAIQGAGAVIGKHLTRRPSKAELEATNILNRMNQKSVIDRAGDMAGKVASRPGRNQLPGTIHQDYSHVRANQEGRERFRRNSAAVGDWLTQRPTPNQIPNQYYVDNTADKKRGSMEFKENEFESNWERQFTTNRPTPNEIPSRYFQEPGLKDRSEAYNVEQSLRRRPTLDKLITQGLIPNSHMAASLRGKAAAIEGKIGVVPDYDVMLKAGFTPEYLAGKSSASIQPASKRVSNFLDHRISKEELERRGILRNNKATYDRNSAMIQPMFMQRKDRSELDASILSGGVNQYVANSMRPAAFDLEKKLKNRRASQDLFNQNILKIDPSNTDRLAMHKYYQDQKKKKENLEGALKRRMSIDDLQARGIFQGTGVHDQFAERRNQLENNLRRRDLADTLASRPTSQQVPNKYFMEPKRKGRKNRRQSEAFQESAVQMENMLKNRPMPNAVPNEYFQMPDMQQEARMSIAKGFANRMSPAELARRGLIAADPNEGYAPVDMRIFDNNKGDVKAKLENAMRSRPTEKEMQQRGYVSNADIAHGLAPAAHQLQNKLGRRMSVDDLVARNIMKSTTMAPKLQARTEELEKRRLEQSLNGRLSRRPERDELIKTGIIDPRNLTPDQYENQRALKMNLRRHRMEDMLASKRCEQELKQRVFMEGSARRQRGMSVQMQQNTQMMNQLLKNRPAEYEVPNSYFTEPSRKRRMSVEMENTARTLESKLMQRPAKDEIDGDMWITAKDARGHRGRRVSHSMQQNQEHLASLLRGKKDMDQINESVFRKPDAASLLQDKLSRRMSRDDLQRRGILNQYANNQQLAGRMTDLDKQLGRRPTLDHLQQQNIVYQGFGYSMDANMAAQKRLLDRQMKAQHLNQRLVNRPQKSDLADRGYLDDSGLAPRLHPAALALNQQLVDGTRIDRNELVRRGIISGTRRMSRTLQPAAHALEKKLKRRMSIGDLAARNILDNSGRSARVVDAHNKLDRGRRASRVEQMLQHRPDLASLKKKGIYSSENVAPGLQGAAASISKHLKRRPSQADVAAYMTYNPKVSSGRHEERMEDFLATRPLPSDLKRQGVLPGVPMEHQLDDYRWIDNRAEYSKLERKKHQQELAARQTTSQEWIEMKPTSYRRNSMTQRNDVRMGKNRMRRMSNVLQAKLASRPAMADLADRGLLDDSGLAPRLHPTALQVQQNLTSRMQREELVRRGILPDQGHNVSNQLASRVQDLNHAMGRRPTITDVADAGYIPRQYAHDRESKQERRRRISVALDHKLRYRPTKESLADQGILDDSPLAPSLHAKAIDLQTRLIQQMGREELQARGILTSDANVARALQGTRSELERKMRRRMSRQDMNDLGYLDPTSHNLSQRLAGAARQVSKGLRRRPSMDDLRNRNILSQYDQSMPPEMVEQAKQKKRANTSQRIQDMLASRPERDQVSAFKKFAVADMANSLQGAGHNVSKMLRRRPSVDVLQQRNILQGNYSMGASAGRAHELGFQQRRNTISRFVVDQSTKRKQTATLEKFGLPTNIATEDHIKRVLDMNARMMLQMQQMQEQLTEVQMTCRSLVQEREGWKDQVKSLARQNTQELEMLKDYLRDSHSNPRMSSPSAVPQNLPQNLAAPRSDGSGRNSFRSELREFKDQVVGMQEQAKQYLLNERQHFQVKESAFKAHMLESDIQITRLQGEYEFTISSPQAGLKFESCDNGRNLCVKAVLKGSEPEQNGVMPGDVIITIRNPKENRVRRVENQDAQLTLELFRQHPRPMIVKFRKYEAHHQLRDLWRRKRELLENVPNGYKNYAKSPPAEPGAKAPRHNRRNSNLFHETEISRNGITQEMLAQKREMEDALLQLKAAGHTDPIVRAFEEMDENQNGDLNEDEFVKGLYRIGIGEGLTSAQMKHVFKVLDDDASGYIDYNEFEDFLKHGQNDPICEFVQRHIRERIAALITRTEDRVVRAGSMSNVAASMKQQQKIMSEREEMMRALEAARSPGSNPQKVGPRKVRSNTADGDAPKMWREGFSEEDQFRIKQLTQEIGHILENAQSWQGAIQAIRQKIPNLEYEISKELYPLIQNQTIVQRKDIIRRTLHIVDVIYAKVAPTKEEIAADKQTTADINQLVERARRMSRNDEAARHMENLQYQQKRAMEDDQDDTSEDEFEYVGSPVAKSDPAQVDKDVSSFADVNTQLQMENSGMTPEQLQQFKQFATSAEDNEESAFAEEDAENRTNAVRHATVNKPTVASKRRRPSRQARQDAMLGLTGKVYADTPPPEMLEVAEPPMQSIQRRTSERIASAIPKQSRDSMEAPEPLITDDVADDDDDKRAPETPRQDDDVKRSPKNLDAGDAPRESTGGGELIGSGDETTVKES